MTLMCGNVIMWCKNLRNSAKLGYDVFLTVLTLLLDDGQIFRESTAVQSKQRDVYTYGGDEDGRY